MTAINYEGAMLGGYFLPEQQFVEVMTELLNERGEEIAAKINTVLYHINRHNRGAAYTNWEEIEQQYFVNPTVQLLAVINETGDFTQNNTYYFSKESDFFTKSIYGNKNNKQGVISVSQLEKIGEAIKNSNADFLDNHYAGMVNSLDDEITPKEISWFWDIYGEKSNLRATKYYNSLLSEEGIHEMRVNLNDVRWHGLNGTYANVVYSAKNINGNVGQSMDAFVNHLGKMHNQIFGTSGRTLTINAKNENWTTSVKNEENADPNAYYGFLKLLIDSKNSVGWWTGGDLIATDASGLVTFNIQVKTRTTRNQLGTIAAVSTSRLKTELKKIITLFNNKENNSLIAQNFYNILKTSTVSDQVAIDIQKVEEKLGLSVTNGKSSLGLNLPI